MDEMDGYSAAHTNHYYWVNTLNPYKRAWYLACTPGAHERTIPVAKPAGNGSDLKKRTKSKAAGIARQELTQAALGAGMIASRYAAVSGLTGNLGVGIRIGGRIGLRVIPVVGAALIAYDLYQFGKWLAE